MDKLIVNHSFHLCVICILSFITNGSADDLRDAIRHGYDAVMMAKGF